MKKTKKTTNHRTAVGNLAMDAAGLLETQAYEQPEYALSSPKFSQTKEPVECLAKRQVPESAYQGRVGDQRI